MKNLGIVEYTPYPGWRFRVDEKGTLHHERIPGLRARLREWWAKLDRTFAERLAAKRGE